jgi:hypothetical protein
VFDLPTAAPFLAASVGLTGSLVAGLSVYLSYRGRHNLIRQIVYGRQLDAYFDIAAAMTALYTAAENAVAAVGLRLTNEEAQARVRAALRSEHERFIEAVNRSLIVLPSRVKAAVDQFNEAMLAVCEPLPDGPSAGPAADAPGLAGAYERVLNSIRHHMAIDSLTTGMLREMGIGSESMAMKVGRARVSPLVPVGRGNP